MDNITQQQILLMLEQMEDELMLAEVERMAGMAEAGAVRAELAQRADAALRTCKAVIARAQGGCLVSEASRKLFDTHAGITLEVRLRGSSSNLLALSLRMPYQGEASLVAERPGSGVRQFSGKLALAQGAEPQLANMVEQVLQQAFQLA